MEQDNKELQEKVKDFIDKEKLSQLEEMLVTNSVEFDCNNKKYRIKKPAIKQRMIVEKEIFKTTNQLVSEGFLFEEQWKKKLKESQGIDLDSYTDKILNITKQIEAKMDILAPTVNENERKKIIFEIDQLKNERAIAHIELTNHKAPCIDSQLLNKSVYLYTWLLTEIKEGENWKQRWSTFEEFESSEEEELVAKAIQIVMKYTF